MDYFVLEKPKHCIICKKTENEIQCHSFPQDMEMAMKWAKSVGSNANIPIYTLQSKYVVCQDHFCDDDYGMKLNFIAGDGTAFETGFQLNSTAVPNNNNPQTKTKRKSPVKTLPESNQKSQLKMLMQNLIYGKQKNIEDDKVNNNDEGANIQHEIISKFNVQSLADLEIECSDEITPMSHISNTESTEELLGMSIPKHVAEPISDSEEQPPRRQFSPQPIMKCDSEEMLVEILKNSNSSMSSCDTQDAKYEDANVGEKDAYHGPIRPCRKNNDAVQAALADEIVSFNTDESNRELYKRLCEYAARVEELEATVQRYEKSHVVLRQQISIMRRELKSLAVDHTERS